MARSVGSGIYAAVGWGPLKVVVAVHLWFGALSAVIPFLITVCTGGIAGESIAAGMAGVVAVRLQKKKQSKKPHACRFISELWQQRGGGNKWLQKSTTQ